MKRRPKREVGGAIWLTLTFFKTTLDHVVVEGGNRDLRGVDVLGRGVTRLEKDESLIGGGRRAGEVTRPGGPKGE